MATGGLYGQSNAGIVSPQSGSESSGLYGNNTVFGGSYFEWFIFQVSDTQLATPTGGSWSFTTNTGTPPSGWVANPPVNPTNTVWVSIGLVNSKSNVAISWSTPGKFSFSSGLPILSGTATPLSGDGQSDQLYIQTSTAPETIWFKQAGTWTRLTGSTLYADLTSDQTINGTKTFVNQIQGSVSGTSSNISGIVDITHGGTGSTTASAARTALGVTATGSDATYAYRANNLSDLASASTSRTNLGLGSIATQNSNSVAITGGAIDGTTIGATTRNSGDFTTLSANTVTNVTPVLSFNASNTIASFGSNTASSYNQLLIQNKSATAGASTNYVISNNLGTDSTYYGEFGMNASTYSSGTPADFFSLNNGVYFSAHDSDVTVGSGNGFKTYLAWGTAGQSAHVINNSGAIGLNTNITGTSNFGTSGQVLTSAGSAATPIWTTPAIGSVTSVSVSGGATGLTTSGNPITGSGTITLAGTLALANGGTGATTRQNAMDALAGSVTSGQYLRGNGTDVVMSAIQAADVPILNQSTTGNATAATNLLGGATGSLPYQSATNVTTFLAGNTTTTPQFVTSTGVAGLATAPTLTSSTGSGNVVLATSPTLVTPALGTPSALVGTNITGTAAGLSIGGSATGGASGAIAATTLSASSTVSGTGFSTYLASPPAIGGTSAAAGSFTTLSASSSVTLSGGTANGLAYLNGSKVLTTGSALVFDGTNLGIGTSSPTAYTTRFIEVSNATSSGLKLTATSGNALGAAVEFVASDKSMRIGTYESTAYIQFRTQDTERARIDSSGNLGLGVTPSTYSTGKVVEVGYAGNAFWGYSANTNLVTQNTNLVAGVFKYSSTNPASYYQQSAGVHSWGIAPSGTAGNGITFTQAMALDASGNLTVPTIYTNTTASVTYVAVSSAGLLQRGGVSALKYKQDVRDLESIDINKFRSVRYKSKCENDDKTKDHFGFIADEVAEQGLTELITYNENGDIEGFQYERMCVVLLKNAQEQQAIITQLQADVAALKGKA